MQTELSLRIKPELDDLYKSVGKIKKSLEIDLGKGIKDAIDKTSSSLSKNLKFKDLFSNDLKKVNKTLRDSANLQLDLGMEKSLDKIKSGTTQIVATGVAAYGTIGKVIRDSMSFEESFADVRKVLDESTNTDKLKEGVLKMSTWIGYSANELNKIAFSAGQMGLKGEENILKFTELASKMGIAFDSSSEEAGEAMGKMMNIFGLGLGEVESLGDAINNLANNTNAKAMDIVNVLGRIGGSAKDFGLTAEQTAALSDSFIALGQSPEIAGTAIKNLLGKLNAGKGNVVKWFNNLGIDYDAWAELKAKSPEEALRGFLGEIGKLEGRQKTLAISEMFGLENLDKISTLSGALENYDKAIGLNKGDYKGSMEAEYQARAKTTAFEFVKLNQTINRISVTIGEQLLPFVNSAVEYINELLDPLSNWVKNNQKLVKGIMLGVGAIMAFKIAMIGASITMSVVSVILYPLQKIFIALRFSTIGSTLALIKHRIALIASSISTKAHILATNRANLATKAWGITTSLFSKIFKLSMWVIKGALITTGIGALIVGIGVAMQYVVENWENISPRLVAIWDWIKEAISPVVKWFEKVFGFIAKGIDKILSGARVVTDFLGITDSKSLASSTINTQGLVDSTLEAQARNTQSFYNSTQNRQINDNKTIYITTSANANDVAKAVSSYSYAD